MQPQHAFMNVQELLHQATARSRAAASLPSSARHASATPSSQAEAQSLPANGQLPQDESGEVAYARGSSSDGPAPVSAAAAATNVQPALTKPESEAPVSPCPCAAAVLPACEVMKMLRKSHACTRYIANISHALLALAALQHQLATSLYALTSCIRS